MEKSLNQGAPYATNSNNSTQSKRKAQTEQSASIPPAKKVPLREKYSYEKKPVNQPQIRVGEMKPTTNQRNLKSKAGAISNHLTTWKQITSDQWILKRILGTTTEAENLKDVTLGESKHYKNNLTDIERMLFQKRN